MKQCSDSEGSDQNEIRSLPSGREWKKNADKQLNIIKDGEMGLHKSLNSLLDPREDIWAEDEISQLFFPPPTTFEWLTSLHLV